MLTNNGKKQENTTPSLENKHKPAASRGFHKGNEERQSFQIDDMSEEAQVQNRLQEKVNNSPQIKHAMQLQSVADNYTSHYQSIVNKDKRITQDSTDLVQSKVSQNGETIQRVAKRAQIIWKATHVVKEQDNSLFGDGDYLEGEIGQRGELTEGQILTVDDGDIFISRRGPNQENPNIRNKDRESTPSKEWYRVLYLNEEDVSSKNLYIRAGTFDWVSDDETETDDSPIFKVNSAGGQYDNDMLKGGAYSTKVSVRALMKYWQSSQRDQNVHAPAVSTYLHHINKGNSIDAPFFDSIDMEDETIVIRTSEGRHRIHAAHMAGLEHIYVLQPSQMALQLVEILGLTEELFS